MPKVHKGIITPSRIFILLMLAVGAWLWLDVLKSEAAGATSIYGAPCGRNCQYGCCRADQCVPCGDEDPPPIQPPGISGVLNCSGGAVVNGWCTTSLSLDLSAWDPYGSPVMIFGKVNGVDYSCPYGATTCSVPLTAEGTGTASYRVTSGTGQTSGEYTVNYQLDLTTPQVNGTLSGTPGLNNYYVSPVSVSATATDQASGIASLEYSVNGGTWTAYSSPFVLPDGSYSLTLRATDWAGHVSVTAPQTVQVDATTPILNASISGTPGSNGWYISQVTVSAGASDQGSGLASFEANVDGGGYVPYSSPITFTDGSHTIQFKAVDNAGNLTETTAQTINVDTTTPTLTLDVAGTLGTNGWYTSAVVITPNASDPYPSGTMSTGSGQAGSGLDTLRGSQDGGPLGDLNSPLAFNADGIHSYQIIVCDKAGLCTDTAAQQIRIDTVRPILTLPALWILGNSAAYSAEDPTSGLAQATVRIQGQQYQDNLSGNSASAGLYWNGILSNGRPAPEGEYDMIVKVVDAAGNEVTGYTKVQVEPLAALLRPFVRIPPLGNPLPTPTPISPSVLAPIMPLTFGGQAHNPPLPVGAPFGDDKGGGEGVVSTVSFGGVTGSAGRAASVQGFGVDSTTTASPLVTIDNWLGLSSDTSTGIPWGVLAGVAGAVLASGMALQKMSSGISLNPVARGILMPHPQPSFTSPVVDEEDEKTEGRVEPPINREKGRKDGPDDVFEWLSSIISLIDSAGDLKQEVPIVATALRRIATAYEKAVPSLDQIDSFDQTLTPYLRYDPNLPVPKSGVASDILIASYQKTFGKSPTIEELLSYEAWRQYLKGNLNQNQYTQLADELTLKQVNRLTPASQIDLAELKRIYNVTEAGAGTVGGASSIAGLIADYLGYDAAGQKLTATGTTLGGWADLSQGLTGLTKLFGGSTIVEGAEQFAATISPVARWLGVAGGGLQYVSSGYRLATEEDLQTMGNERYGVGMQMLGGGFLFVGSLALLLGVTVVGAPVLGTILLAAAPVGLVLGAIGLAVEHWDWITTTVKDSVQVWKNNFQQGGEIADKLTKIAVTRVANGTASVLDAAGDGVITYSNSISNATLSIGNAVGDVIINYANAASNVTRTVGNAVGNAVTNYANSAANVTKTVGNAIGNAATTAANTAANTIKQIGNASSNSVVKYVTDAAASVVANTGNSVTVAVKNISNTIATAQQAVGSAVGNAIKSVSNTVATAQKAAGNAVGTVVKSATSTVANAQKAVGQAVGNGLKSLGRWFK